LHKSNNVFRQSWVTSILKKSKQTPLLWCACFLSLLLKCMWLFLGIKKTKKNQGDIILKKKLLKEWKSWKLLWIWKENPSAETQRLIIQKTRENKTHEGAKQRQYKRGITKLDNAWPKTRLLTNRKTFFWDKVLTGRLSQSDKVLQWTGPGQQTQGDYKGRN